jgi:hypothetical protein
VPAAAAAVAAVVARALAAEYGLDARGVGALLATGWVAAGLLGRPLSNSAEAVALLALWAPPTPEAALELLDSAYPDPKVRAYAASALEDWPDALLEEYALQLVQVLKYEPFTDSALARLLLRRAAAAPATLGHALFWYLRAECDAPAARDRFSALAEAYVRALPPAARLDLGNQLYAVVRLACFLHCRHQLLLIALQPQLQLNLEVRLIIIGK